ncbi:MULTISPECIES: hypothetical protein [unclassified Ruegeria]|uniref:hypothetical protein n=1 Tax=unclassified Ruegeria TaxID=2625375 RepID=UPI001490D47F|nr:MULTISPECIES: hypothetical protein [unclassified Ruegeria]NOD36984.1 hypothetical protein [Ruegeria sp. HKCCD7296]NOE44129.1 hypothetical protein [Ruegeria sp. HKCCD7319]
MAEIDPKVSLEIQKTKAELSQELGDIKSELRSYSDAKSEKARNSSLAVLGLVTAVLGVGGAISINSLIGRQVTASIEEKVEVVVQELLPVTVPQALSEIVPSALTTPVNEYLESDEFAGVVGNSLTRAVEVEFEARVPDSVVAFIEAEHRRAEEIAARAEEINDRLQSADERPFQEVDFEKLASDAVASSWDPASLLGQIQAQATCVALSPKDAWVTAIPRTCDNTAPTCAEICASAASRTSDSQITGASRRMCTASLHVYANPPADSVDRVGLKTFTYSSCGGRHCGPNYCCCSSY